MVKILHFVNLTIFMVKYLLGAKFYKMLNPLKQIIKQHKHLLKSQGFSKLNFDTITFCSMTFCFSFDVLIKLNPIQVNIRGGGPP